MPKDDSQDRMNKSMAAARLRVAVAAPKPPVIANVAATVAPEAHDRAALLQSARDEFGYEVAFRMAFLGAGQGGGRMVDAFWQLGYRRAAAFNTTDMDFAGLAEAMPKYSLDVGGASKDTDLARRALKGREEEVRDLLTRAWGSAVDCALICTSLGGGTGSGTAPELVKIVRKYMEDHKLPARVGAVVSLPAVTEGFQICRNAYTGFQQLVEMKVSPLIVIDNERTNKLYRPTMLKPYAAANENMAQLFHLFNQLAAVRSEIYTFDRSEFGQLLDSGLVTMGASDIQKFDSPADVSEAIRDQVGNSVLAEVNLATGRKAACLFVASEDVLSRLGREYFDAGFTQLERTLGSAQGSDVPTIIHPGLYQGEAKGLQAYVLIGELDLPRERLLALARKGGLASNVGAVNKVADFLGVNDGTGEHKTQ